MKRFRKFMRSLPLITIFALVVVPTFAYFWGQQSAKTAPTDHGPPFINGMIVSVGMFGLALIAIQTWVDYMGHQYDPTWAMKLQDMFYEHDTRQARGRAARYYQKRKEWTRDVEAALDIIEDLGFYVESQTIGVEVAHHHFYFWIRGYVQTAEEYIRSYRRDDPLAYDHCFSLLDSVSTYEAKKLGVRVETLRWEKNEIDDFIRSEIDECDGASSSS